MVDDLIKKEIQFALYAIKKNIQSSAELRTSFIMNIVGMTINNSAFIFLWIFFIKSVGVINGWQAIDIVALQAFTALSFGIVFSFFAGIIKISDYVASGVFDRFMLSPKNLLLRVSTSSFGVSAIGDIVFAIICLFIYAFYIKATLIQLLGIVLLMAISSLIFFSVTLIIFSTSFYFMDASSVTTGLFEMFLTPGMFHGGAFQGILRFIFTFIIPSLLIGTFPVEIIRNTSTYQILTMLIVAMIWFMASLTFFYFSVRKYESSNFFTFGG